MTMLLPQWENYWLYVSVFLNQDYRIPQLIQRILVFPLDFLDVFPFGVRNHPNDIISFSSAPDLSFPPT